MNKSVFKLRGKSCSIYVALMPCDNLHPFFLADNLDSYPPDVATMLHNATAHMRRTGAFRHASLVSVMYVEFLPLTKDMHQNAGPKMSYQCSSILLVCVLEAKYASILEDIVCLTISAKIVGQGQINPKRCFFFLRLHLILQCKILLHTVILAITTTCPENAIC